MGAQSTRAEKATLVTAAGARDTCGELAMESVPPCWTEGRTWYGAWGPRGDVYGEREVVAATACMRRAGSDVQGATQKCSGRDQHVCVNEGDINAFEGGFLKHMRGGNAGLPDLGSGDDATGDTCSTWSFSTTGTEDEQGEVQLPTGA